MRHALSGAYGGGWPDRVRKMSEYQVIAIYHRMLEQNPVLLLSNKAKERIGIK